MLDIMISSLCFLLLLSPANAEDGVLIRPGGETRPASQAAPVQSSTATPISLDLVNADIHSVLRLISAVSGLNFVATDDVKGTVTVRLVEVPWDQALAVILHSKGLAATPVDQRVVVVGHP